jgi:exodeoxyribonuclease VIII
MNYTPPMGLHFDVPSGKYHADLGVSNSMLSSMAKSPAHCWGLHLDPMRPEIEATDAMKGGTLTHCAILEPEELLKRYVIKPEGMTFATKEGKDWRAAQPAGLGIIAGSDLERVKAQRAAVMSVKALADMLAVGHPEASAFAIDKATGLRVRCRPDWVQRTAPKRARVLDVKTISDLTYESVMRAIGAYGYHRQQAHYTNVLQAAGWEVDEFVFGFVSSSYPYVAAAFVLDEESVGQAHDEVGELLDRFANCQRNNHWPAFGDGYQLTGLPKWAKRSNEIEIEVIQ